MGTRQGTGWGGTGTGKGHGMGTRDGDTAPGTERDLRSPGPRCRHTWGPEAGDVGTLRGDPSRGPFRALPVRTRPGGRVPPLRPAGMPRERERAEHVGRSRNGPAAAAAPRGGCSASPRGWHRTGTAGTTGTGTQSSSCSIPAAGTAPGRRDRAVPGAGTARAPRAAGGSRGAARAPRAAGGNGSATAAEGPGSTGGATAGLGDPGTGQPPGDREESRGEQRGPGPRRSLREMGSPVSGEPRGRCGERRALPLPS